MSRRRCTSVERTECAGARQQSVMTHLHDSLQQLVDDGLLVCAELRADRLDLAVGPLVDLCLHRVVVAGVLSLRSGKRASALSSFSNDDADTGIFAHLLFELLELCLLLGLVGLNLLCRLSAGVLDALRAVCGHIGWGSQLRYVQSDVPAPACSAAQRSSTGRGSGASQSRAFWTILEASFSASRSVWIPALCDASGLV